MKRTVLTPPCIMLALSATLVAILVFLTKALAIGYRLGPHPAALLATKAMAAV